MQKKIYLGAERRISSRRQSASERRDLIRYEIEKELRRSGCDRRRGYGVWGGYCPV